MTLPCKQQDAADIKRAVRTSKLLHPFHCCIRHGRWFCSGICGKRQNTSVQASHQLQPVPQRESIKHKSRKHDNETGCGQTHTRPALVLRRLRFSSTLSILQRFRRPISFRNGRFDWLVEINNNHPLIVNGVCTTVRVGSDHCVIAKISTSARQPPPVHGVAS